MMKVTVIREFIDKHTGTLHPVGEVLTVTRERYAEICRAGQLVRPAALGRRDKEEQKNGHEDP